MQIWWPWEFVPETAGPVTDFLLALHPKVTQVLSYEVSPQDERAIVDFLQAHREDIVYLGTPTHVGAAILARIPCYWVEWNLTDGNILAVKQYVDCREGRYTVQLWPTGSPQLWKPISFEAYH
jgi:hypothetical protein